VETRYDYIVIGAGSAGCPLANRLSADPERSVLLIESGPEHGGMMMQMPRGVGKILNPGSKVLWEYQVEAGGNQPAERWYRGRALGGSSSVNGMIYVRGAPLDYDGWAAMGCAGWGWSDIGRKFVELEDHDLGPATWRGAGGPLKITTHRKGDRLFEAILTAAEQMGVARVEDVNDVDAVRDGAVGYQPTTRFSGERFSAALAFLDPVRGRKNLDVATETNVLKIEFTGNRATGVLLRDKNGVRSVQAAREIILSAGAFETPKLLMLSGVGPGDLLKSLGIEPVVHAPDVGRNLREHRHVDLQLKVTSHSHNTKLAGGRLLLSVLQYMLLRSGPMTHASHEIGGFVKSEPGLDHADLQFGLLSTAMAGIGKDGAVQLAPYPGITFLSYFTRPESQGEVRIRSPDPDVPPTISANQLSAEIDRRKFVAAFRWNRRLAQQPALKPWIVEETGLGATLNTDDEILANAMSLGGGAFHMAGTARMGTDPNAVLDPLLRVRGVEGLRVADTSIMPTLVSGNTNGPAMVIGLRAADFILAEERAPA
jgi:choline dehydrogenase-like flavoprotein